MALKLTKKEFETLWNIENSWQTDPKRASSDKKEISKYNQIFKKLNKLSLIKIENRDSSIYGATTTKKGQEILKNKIYKNYIPE